jgi:hypothetical protein
VYAAVAGTMRWQGLWGVALILHAVMGPLRTPLLAVLHVRLRATKPWLLRLMGQWLGFSLGTFHRGRGGGH